MILATLLKAGVQNTVKGEKLAFKRLDSFPGAWLQAGGEYVTADGYTRKVAVTVGLQYGTVGPEQIKEAAKEALRGAGFDLLLVCGFAFDARAGEIAAEFKPSVPDESNFAVRQSRTEDGPAARAAGQDEPGPRDGREPAQEHGRRQPLHGLRGT